MRRLVSITLCCTSTLTIGEVLRLEWIRGSGHWLSMGMAASIVMIQVAVLTIYFRLPMLMEKAMSSRDLSALDDRLVGNIQMVVGTLFTILSTEIIWLLVELAAGVPSNGIRQ